MAESITEGTLRSFEKGAYYRVFDARFSVALVNKARNILILEKDFD